MTGLAQWLVQRGFVVTGSVPASGPIAERLGRLGIRVHAGHSPRSVPRSARLLVYGPDVPAGHPDRLSARVGGVEQQSAPSVVAGLLHQGVGIAAIGGRRASLAAAMVGWTLTHAGLDPTVLLNSTSTQLGGSGRLGLGPHVVVEGGTGLTESDLIGVGLVILHDFSDPSSRRATLDRLVEASPEGGYVLGFADEREDTDLGPDGLSGRVERFSLAPGHAWWGADLRQERGCYRFRAFHHGRFALEVRLQVPGRHLVLGALAAVAACVRVDLDCRAIKEGLEEFAGISRRFESRGSYRGVTLVDDEAEGPGGVGEALGTAREVHGRRRVCVAYRHPSGRRRPWPDRSEFAQADRVWIVDRDHPEGDPEAGALAETLAGAGLVVGRASGLDGAIGELDRHLEPGDVLVTLGAGDVGTIADAFLRRLPGDRHA
jgi:UDP-N-acetylmuramate--alanine ligase